MKQHHPKNPVLIESSPEAREREYQAKQATLEQTNEQLLMTFLQGGRLTPIEQIVVSEQIKKGKYFTKNMP